MAGLQAAAARVTKELGQAGRVLLRWSGTEPKLRIMLEGPDEARIRAWASELAEAARRDIPVTA
jgi:phosphoglucosamine mutase